MSESVLQPSQESRDSNNASYSFVFQAGVLEIIVVFFAENTDPQQDLV